MCVLKNQNKQNNRKTHSYIINAYFFSLPTEDAWVFAKANAIQAAGIMSFGE